MRAVRRILGSVFREPAHLVPAGVSCAFGMAVALAALALVLASYGLHAAIRGLVEARRREIAVRMATGASPGRIVAFILRHTANIALTGAIVGAVGAFALAVLLREMFNGIHLLDPTLACGVTTLLTAIATSAAFRPARRAAHAQPSVLLGEE